MTGEMSKADVTREAFPVHFAIADELGGSVHPFDVYQGPYIRARGHKLWLMDDEGFCVIYDETTHLQSVPCFDGDAALIASDLIAGVGCAPELVGVRDDAWRLRDIGEA